jgi:hypothetical protein
MPKKSFFTNTLHTPTNQQITKTELLKFQKQSTHTIHAETEAPKIESAQCH